MITLILDSSNKALCVALAKDGKIIKNTCYDAWQRQSEFMIPEIKKLFDETGIDQLSLNEVIVSCGPGSYTGVRVAMTIAKTIAVCLPVKVYAVSSLEAQKTIQYPCISLINARNNRSYFGVYNGNEVLVKDCIKTNDEVLDFISNNKDFKVVGDCSYLDLIGEKTNLAESLLYSKREENLVENPLALKPVYLKD